MKTFWKAGLILACLAAVSAPAVWAADAGTPGGEPGGGRGKRFVEDLGLSPEQIALLRQNRLESRKTTIKLRAEEQTLQADLSDESTKDQPDAAKLKRITQRLGEVHAQLIAQRAKNVAYLRSILTPEQKQRFEQHLLTDDGKDWGRGREHRGGGDEMDGPEGGEGPK